MRRLGICFALALGSAAVGPTIAQASLISLNAPVVATDGYFSGGLNGEIFPASNIDNGLTGDSGSANNWSFWLTSNTQTGYVTIDLGAIYNISSFVVQDTHNRYYSDRGTNAFTISVGLTLGVSSVVVSDSFSLSDWQNLTLVTETLATPVLGEFVTFSALSAYPQGNSGGAGLNEMDVYGVPVSISEPFSLPLFFTGVVGVTVLRCVRGKILRLSVVRTFGTPRGVN